MANMLAIDTTVLFGGGGISGLGEHRKGCGPALADIMGAIPLNSFCVSVSRLCRNAFRTRSSGDNSNTNNSQSQEDSPSQLSDTQLR